LRHLLRHTALSVALVATTGCAQTFDATTLGVPATLASEGATVPAGTVFKVKAKALWGAWGLIPLNEPSVKKILASQLIDGRSVANVRITTRSSIFDAVISLGTFGVLSPRSVTIEGVVVEAPTGP
jgi:hypothetical protein